MQQKPGSTRRRAVAILQLLGEMPNDEEIPNKLILCFSRKQNLLKQRIL